MKKCIISLVMVMVMFLSVSAYAGAIDLTEYERRCDIGLTLEEKLVMKSAWNIIELVEENATVWYSGLYVIVKFNYGIYEDTPMMKEYLGTMSQAFQHTDSRVIRVFYRNPDGGFIGYADENSKVFCGVNH